jgi:hypothetical protein
LGWLRGEWRKYGVAHGAELESLQQFGDAVNTFAIVYTAGTLGPAGIYAGGLIVVNAGTLGQAAFHSAATSPATIATIGYGVTIFNASVHPAHQRWLPEIIEFEKRVEQIYPWILRR